MPIPNVMLNNVIKASASYSEYLAKSTGSTPAKATGRGKGLLTKDGVEFAMKKVSIPKRKRYQTVTEEIGRSEEAIDDEVDSEGIDEKEVVPLARRKFTGDSIGKEAHQETGVVEEGPGEGSSVTLEVPDVQTFKSTNKGVGMSLEVLDEPSNESSSSSFDSELAIEDISSDDEVTEKADEDVEKVDTVFDKSDGVKIADVEKDSDAQVAEEQPVGQQTRDEEHGANIEPTRVAQADV
ncbi:hypothetical protein Tco_0695354 [Tanacetum coccineum]